MMASVRTSLAENEVMHQVYKQHQLPEPHPASAFQKEALADGARAEGARAAEVADGPDAATAGMGEALMLKALTRSWLKTTVS